MIIDKCIYCNSEVILKGKKTSFKDIEDGLMIDCSHCGKMMIVEDGKLIEYK